MKKITLIIFTLFSILICPKLEGSILSGEILFEQIGNQTIEASVIIYVEAELEKHNIDSIRINWGDGAFEEAFRTNGADVDGNGYPDGEMISDQFSRHIYKSTHTYDDLGEYTLSMTTPNRGSGIINVNFPNSGFINFYIESLVIVQEDFENNHSPVLLEAPADHGYLGHPFIHIVNAFDIDDDSLAYELVTPLSDHGLEVPNYVGLEAILPGQNNQLHFDEETGLILWDSPQIAGIYNIAILIKSYRNGEIVDKVIRDMQISIIDGSDTFPEITLNTIEYEIQEVNVGNEINVEVLTTDENETQILDFTSSSGLYEYFNNPAQFTGTVNGNEGNGTFAWSVKEEHLRTQPYQIVFKSKDNYLGLGYANFKLIRYKVNNKLVNATEASKKLELNVFPNPVEKLVTVELVNSEITKIRFQIVNIQGIEVKAGRLTNAITAISLEDLPSGAYLLIVEGQKGSQIEKTIIKR